MKEKTVELRIITDSFEDPKLSETIRAFATSTAHSLGLDLAALEAITITGNYDLFLKQFDLGFGSGDRLSASKGDNVGVGVTPEVLRNGRLMSNVILPRAVAQQLLSQDGSPENKRTQYIVSHELAHADEHTKGAQAMTEGIIALHQKPQMFKVANRAIWGEYYACRKSAKVEPAMTPTFVNMFHDAYAGMLDSLEVIRAQFLRDQDRNSAQGKAANLAIGVFMALARLLGHVDGIGSSIQSAAPTVYNLMQDRSGHGGIFVQLQSTLTRLWDTFPQWNGLQALDRIFDNLNSLLKAL